MLDSRITPFSSKIELNMSGTSQSSNARVTPDLVQAFVLFMSERNKNEWPDQGGHGQKGILESNLLQAFNERLKECVMDVVTKHKFNQLFKTIQKHRNQAHSVITEQLPTLLHEEKRGLATHFATIPNSQIIWEIKSMQHFLNMFPSESKLIPALLICKGI